VQNALGDVAGNIWWSPPPPACRCPSTAICSWERTAPRGTCQTPAPRRRVIETKRSTEIREFLTSRVMAQTDARSTEEEEEEMQCRWSGCSQFLPYLVRPRGAGGRGAAADAHVRLSRVAPRPAAADVRLPKHLQGVVHLDAIPRHVHQPAGCLRTSTPPRSEQDLRPG